MSRILLTGDNQITCSYAKHCANVAAGKAWAQGVDIVKYKSQVDTIVAHSAGTIIKVIDYMSGTNGVADKEGMGYGNYVMIKHTSKVCTLYAHLDKVYVKEGATVAAGQSIGTMGNTGNSFGAHLHFEIREYSSGISGNLHDNSKFKWMDPTKYIDDSLPVTKTYSGFVDGASADNVSGWCYNGLDDTAEQVTVKLYVNGKVIKTVTGKANGYRKDLETAGIGNGKHGYTIDISGLSAGTYVVRAYAPDGTELPGSGSVKVKTITVKASTAAVKAGNKYQLKNTPVYYSETGPVVGKRSGEYYVHSDEVKNGRIRMTNSTQRVGVAGQVSFWVAVNDLK